MDISGQNGSVVESDPAFQAKFLVISCYIGVHLFCIFGNVLVLTVICRHPKMRGVTNFLLANLAVADLAVATFCTGQQYVFLTALEDWAFGSGLLGRSLCKAYGFIRNVAFTTSISILTLIAAERFVAIVHPFSGRTFLMSRTTLRWCVAGAWLLGCIVSSPNVFGFDAFPHEFSETIDGQEFKVIQTGCYRDHTLPISWETYDFALFILYYAFPVATMTFLYAAIANRLARSTDGDLDGIEGSQRHTISVRTYMSSLSSGQGSQKSNDAKCSLLQHQESLKEYQERSQRCIVAERKKVIRMMIVVVGVFVVCWLPVHIRKLVLYVYGYENWLGEVFLPFSDWLLNLNSALNPVLYTLFSARFRECAWDVVLCRVEKKRWVRPIHK